MSYPLPLIGKNKNKSLYNNFKIFVLHGSTKKMPESITPPGIHFTDTTKVFYFTNTIFNVLLKSFPEVDFAAIL